MPLRYLPRASLSLPVPLPASDFQTGLPSIPHHGNGNVFFKKELIIISTDIEENDLPHEEENFEIRKPLIS